MTTMATPVEMKSLGQPVTTRPTFAIHFVLAGDSMPPIPARRGENHKP